MECSNTDRLYCYYFHIVLNDDKFCNFCKNKVYSQ